MDFSVVILAAGAGSRMYSSKPKVLHTICGKPMIDMILTQALSVSDDVRVVLYHQKDAIESYLRAHFSAHFASGALAIHIQDHANLPGTGGALLEIAPESKADSNAESTPESSAPNKQALRFKHKRVVVLNGDMPLILSSSIESIAKTKASAVVGVIELENPQGYGRVVLSSAPNLDSASNLDSAASRQDSASKLDSASKSPESTMPRISRIVEQKDCDEKEAQIKLVNAGIYAFDTHILEANLPKISNNNAQKEYYLTEIIALIVQQEKSASQNSDTNTSAAKSNDTSASIAPFYISQDEFIGVNTKYELSIAESMQLRKLRKQAMDKGVIMRLPETIYLESSVVFEGECEIENNVRLCGDTKIIRSHIKAGSVVEDAIIDSSDIGPMARVRPKSHIKNTHIGNFVEAKNAHMQGVKAGHLSYLGDCEIGEGSNIGAGVITCNYDGKKKHKTTIGKNVFIGSDSQLIAPVNIESDTLIAAGSSITADVKEGELAISRAKQQNKSGFFYKFFGKTR
ncbi:MULTISPECIES: NTP transferase domain-containing protein [unclassified Helicobacter]|uniref:NTP transferase domain-containing protein n=1 Tax=unclassified Helicobacter TaxID=2593540 RepID=UPI000ACF8F6A|nr:MULTISPECIES: NTP transferase domain-containing protein [unclassified Helicobacter]